MNNRRQFSDEQLDFFEEIMNIGAGNAATALSQILGEDVDLKIPEVHFLTATKVASVLGLPDSPFVCVRIGMVGDVRGDLFLFVPDEHKRALIQVAERAAGLVSPEQKTPQSTADISALTEIGNILAGVYLTAIHDFCRLNIYHTVPVIAIDMAQALLDESIISLARQVRELILVKNEFTVRDYRMDAYLLMVPIPQSVKVFVDAIKQARAEFEK